MCRGLGWLGAAIVLPLAWPLATSAQTFPVPGSVLPSQIPERLPPQPQAPPLSPSVTAPPEGTAAPPGAEGVRFRLTGVTVTGNQVIGEPELRPLWAAQLGQQITLAQVYALAEAITAKYRDAGYILARAVVPPQRIENGQISIRVIEGYIDRVTVNGGPTGGAGLANDIAGHLTEARPLTAAVLERYLLLLNDLPGITVQSVLAPSPTAPGAADMTITLSETRVTGFASLDNRGSRYVGPFQSNLGGQITNLFNHYNSTQAQFLTIPYRPDELVYGSLTHVEPLNDEGTTLSIGASYAETQPKSQLTSLGLDGTSKLVTFLVQHPFIRSRSENLFGRVSFDYRDETTDIGRGTVNLYKDRIRPLRLGGTYNVLDSQGGTNEATLVLSQGIPILHESQDGGPELSRAAGQSDFTKLDLDLSRLQTITDHWSVLLAASGQFAFNPLLVSEEFGLGGTLYDRAFDPSEMLGDDALAGKIELRYSDTLGYPFLQAYQLYSYFDAGHVWTLRTPTGEKDQQGGESFGIGVRFDLTQNFGGSVEGALPIGRRVAAFAPSGGQAPRVFFSLTARF